MKPKANEGNGAPHVGTRIDAPVLRTSSAAEGISAVDDQVPSTSPLSKNSVKNW